MTTPGDSRDPGIPAPYSIRSPREELEDYARRRLESGRRADASEAMRIEDALHRALELLEEAENDDDPA